MKKNHRIVSLFLAVCLIFSSFNTTFGASASDIKGHWAEDQISNWMDKGFINGFTDGTFKPDKTITRSEFLALVNRSFGFTNKTSITFTDVKEKAWYYSDIQLAVEAGYITGYQNNTFHPNDEITRVEMAAIIAKLLDLNPAIDSAITFRDEASIAAWAKGAVIAVADKEIMSGDTKQNFMPTKVTTRAEAVVALDKALKLRMTSFDQAGTYGPAVGSQVISGDVVVAAESVTLQNMVIEGNLLLGEEIRSGDAFLKNVTVKGVTTVKGGGEESIHFENSTLLTLVVDKALGTVRIVAEGTTTVAKVVVQSPVTLEESALTNEGFKEVVLTNLLPKDSQVTMKGFFQSLDIVGAQIKVNIPSGSVSKVTTSTTAEGLTLELGKEAKILSLVLEAAAKMLGNGTIEKVTFSEEVKAKTTFETKPVKMEDKNGNEIPSAPVIIGNTGGDSGGNTDGNTGGNTGGESGGDSGENTGGDTTAPSINNASLTVDNGLLLEFSIDEEIDLNTSADVKIEYFQDTGSGPIAISNTIEGGALVKDKTWDGYLWSNDSGQEVNYSKGTANTEAYENVIPAGTHLATLVKKGHHANEDMDYVEIDWTEPATYVVKITVTDNAGNVSEVTEVKATVTDPTDPTVPSINNATLTVDNGLLLEFSINQEIDLDNPLADVKIEYFTKSGNVLTAIKNTTLDADLVKDKTWDGYLWSNVSGIEVNYSKGTDPDSPYENVIPANTELATLVKQGHHANGDMDYVEIDWTEPATYVVKITVTANDGKVSEVRQVEVTKSY